MAGCYHDKQDFKSDLDIEVAREGDILEDGQDLDEIECEKNPGHRGFIPFKDLTLNHLPNAVRYKETLDSIKKIGSIVVRIVRGRLVGSGYVAMIESHSGFPLMCINTNNHVVNTNDDVKRCSVEFNYDSKDRSSVVTSKGVKLVSTCPDRDITVFLFRPIPDFLYRLDWNDYNTPTPSTVIMYRDNEYITEETIALGPLYPYQSYFSRLNLNSSFIDIMFISWFNGAISYINSPYFKFEPIPSDKQKLRSIDIHIDGNKGKSRVISGDVVKFGDEFVVKISGSIFQDEVKKCRLVWKGEVIAHGTRLYFEQIKPSKIASEVCGVDSATILQHYSQECLWLFDCDKPKNIEDRQYTAPLRDVCCIGHPHGGIKMVTIGIPLMYSHERFDRRGRRIDKPEKHCQCKIVSCQNYSCKTCKGSSGSPVFLLVKNPDLHIKQTHFMGKRWKALLPTGDQIENINCAWAPAPPHRIYFPK